jgi:hypothetical protein
MHPLPRHHMILAASSAQPTRSAPAVDPSFGGVELHTKGGVLPTITMTVVRDNFRFEHLVDDGNGITPLTKGTLDAKQGAELVASLQKLSDSNTLPAALPDSGSDATQFQLHYYLGGKDLRHEATSTSASPELLDVIQTLESVTRHDA